MQHALDALSDLQKLDESLYERFMEGGGRVADDAAPDALLRRLSVVTFRGLRGLLGFAVRLRPKDDAGAHTDSLVDDFDFGDTTETTDTSISQQMPAALDLGDFDIDEALDVIDEHQKTSEETRWKEILEKLSSIEYGLRSQLRDLDERLDQSLSQRMVGQALEALDDTRSSVSEGIFALMSSVYQAFLPEVDPSSVAPGHLTSLQRALLVRRGLTDLTRAIAPQNELLQSPKSKPEKKEKALAAVRAALSTFVKGEVFRAMRPADRWELTQFDRSLGEPNAGLASEGLSKYLESLGSVNRREVLVTHDERTMEEIREALAAARPLVELNTQVAADMVKKALSLADTLYGRSAANDDLIIALRDAAPTLNGAGEIDATISTLELLFDEGAG
ncbi:MAG: hypothetical protein ACXWUG_24690 [Polyangiales bacterium]